MYHYTLGISPCPNDTFIFGALAQEWIALPHNYSVHLADVETLNTHAAKAEFDIIKLSVAAVPQVLEQYILLRCGGALGKGCGPMLVARRQVPLTTLRQATIAVPGHMTTANLLLSLHGMHSGPRPEMPFDAIMPAIAAGQADAGVVIHEGRFTYQTHGLTKLLDLGTWWEETTNMPLPLGCIAVKRSLGMPTALQIEKAIRNSLAYAQHNPTAMRAFIRKHAQELGEAVIDRHIKTFVNDYSMNLGPQGMRAIETLTTRSAAAQGCNLPNVPLFVQDVDV